MRAAFSFLYEEALFYRHVMKRRRWRVTSSTMHVADCPCLVTSHVKFECFVVLRPSSVVELLHKLANVSSCAFVRSFSTTRWAKLWICLNELFRRAALRWTACGQCSCREYLFKCVCPSTAIVEFSVRDVNWPRLSQHGVDEIATRQIRAFYALIVQRFPRWVSTRKKRNGESFGSAFLSDLDLARVSRCYCWFLHQISLNT